jgi:dUTP pyrophosphatase
MKINIKKINPEARVPVRDKVGDAGYDLFSVEEKTLAPGERYTFKTGVAFEIPAGHVMLIWDRSGLAVKHGITTLGGVVDPNFRGEVGVCLLNTGDESHTVNVGDKIAQFIIQTAGEFNFVETDELSDSARGSDWAEERGGVNY